MSEPLGSWADTPETAGAGRSFLVPIVIDAGFLRRRPPLQRLQHASLGIELVMRPVSISDLPPEVLEQILSPLPPADILKMKEVPSN